MARRRCRARAPKIRSVGALTRQALLGLASTSLGVPVANLTIGKGVISGGGRVSDFGELVGGKLFKITGANVEPAAGRRPGEAVSGLQDGAARTRTRSSGSTSRPRCTGKYTYVHQVRIPGMLHGRMVRPRGQGAYPYNSNVPVSVDANVDRAYPGRSGRAGQQLPRCCRAEGVRRDPGGCSAQGGVEHEPDPSRNGQPVEALPRAGCRRGRSRRPSAARSRATSTSPSPASAHTVSGELRSPLPGSYADRPELRDRRCSVGRRRRSGATPRTCTASTRTWRTCCLRCRVIRSGSCSTRVRARSATVVSRSTRPSRQRSCRRRSVSRCVCR